MHYVRPTGRPKDVRGMMPAPKGLGFSAQMSSVMSDPPRIPGEQTPALAFVG